MKKQILILTALQFCLTVNIRSQNLSSTIIGDWLYKSTNNDLECPGIISFKGHGSYYIYNDCYGADIHNPVIEQGQWSADTIKNIIILKNRKIYTNYYFHNSKPTLIINIQGINTKSVRFCFTNQKNCVIEQYERMQVNQNLKISRDTFASETIVDNVFVNKVIENDLTFKNLRGIYQSGYISEKLVKNTHAPLKKDTLLLFTYQKDSISFYKAYGNNIPIKIVIYSTKITLDKEIKIGVNKDLFRRKFKSKLLTDKVVVRDLEAGSEFTFLFSEDKLTKIIYVATYLD